MTRIGWTAMLLGVALMMAGCKSEEVADPAPPVVEGNSKVARAVGKALWKGLVNSSAPQGPGEATPFEP